MEPDSTVFPPLSQPFTWRVITRGWSCRAVFISSEAAPLGYMIMTELVGTILQNEEHNDRNIKTVESFGSLLKVNSLPLSLKTAPN